MASRSIGFVTVAAAVLLAATGSSGAKTVVVSYWDPAWSPDGTKIAFVDRGSVPGDLFVMNADGSGRGQLTHSVTYPSESRGARSPAWAPDGGKIVFGYGSSGLDVVDVDADGTGLHQIAPSGFNPDWSPRGRKIAFADGGELNGLSVFVVNPEGSARTLVARPPDYDHSYNGPTWSPDGERMAFTVGPAPDTGELSTYLGIVSRYRGRVSRLAKGAYPVDADWSNDGRKIVFADWRTLVGGGSMPTITVLALRTGALTRLGPGWHPRWSPDGRRIVYVCPPAICVMNADGSNVRRPAPP